MTSAADRSRERVEHGPPDAARRARDAATCGPSAAHPAWNPAFAQVSSHPASLLRHLTISCRLACASAF